MNTNHHNKNHIFMGKKFPPMRLVAPTLIEISRPFFSKKEDSVFYTYMSEAPPAKLFIVNCFCWAEFLALILSGDPNSPIEVVKTFDHELQVPSTDPSLRVDEEEEDASDSAQERAKREKKGYFIYNRLNRTNSKTCSSVFVQSWCLCCSQRSGRVNANPSLA